MIPRCDRTIAWTALRGHFEAHGRSLDLREAFARDRGRFDAFAIEAPDVFADLSKNRWDTATRKLLLALTKIIDAQAHRGNLAQHRFGQPCRLPRCAHGADDDDEQQQ